jgi:hypothetical protein
MSTVFLLETPCDDMFYGFLTSSVHSTLESALNKIRSNTQRPAVFYHNILENKIVFKVLSKNSNYEKCYRLDVWNINEYGVDENTNDNLINDIYLSIHFANGTNYTFKDSDNMFNLQIIYYTIDEIDETHCRIKFIGYDKILNLELDKDKNLVYEI